MNDNNFDFNRTIIDVVEMIRLADDLDANIIDRLYMSLDKVMTDYQSTSLIPKLLAYDLLVLHDNLEGSLKFYSGKDNEYISGVNSKVSEYIEKILLS
ncbi:MULTISPECIES: hypothetical protein [Proteus]|mgnify:FL=1|uniref:Uncharacterized protein n=1 Tax=Proteus mirabilis TaxID=584 RepID=A0AAJ1DH03_PROMI|nr:MULTISPECIES: hypothetical protein [Proteus]HBD5832298.1 hypothetical protein [Escherichia coli]ARX35437.1 hypothetical protein AM402_15150 [Proteus mirabilis]AVB29877.1 hypothetical protein C3940_06770 [Proteus mirabilis]AWS54629.1 hypothetical protein AM356_07205 [Proteus mirabilis]EHT2447624.1 hypothetical protein [Proteus mirabilis]